MGGLIDERPVYLEAEWGVLGALIVDAAYCAAEIFLDVRADEFLHSDCRMVFEAAAGLYHEGAPITRLTLCTKLGEEYRDFVEQLEQVTPTATTFRASVSALKREARRIQAFELAQSIADALRFGGDPDETQPDAEKLLEVLSKTGQARGTSIQNMAVRYFSGMGEKKIFFDWGFDKFNRILLCRKGTNVILAARPSVGKTALALQLALHFAKKHRVAFYSFEMGEEEAMERMMANLSFVDYTKIQRGELNDAEQLAQIRAKDKLQAMQLRFVDANGWTVHQIRADAVRHQIEVVFIDYLQLISHPDAKIDSNDFTRVTEVSRSIQSLAKNHKMMTISLSQFSRGGEDTRPQLKDLRSSGQIEQDADVVAFLYRPPEHELSGEQLADYDNLREFKIAKNRNGQLGKMRLWFQGQYQHFMQEWDHFYDTQPQPMPPGRPPEQLKLGGQTA